jgi:hypothetical protein
MTTNALNSRGSVEYNEFGLFVISFVILFVFSLLFLKASRYIITPPKHSEILFRCLNFLSKLRREFLYSFYYFYLIPS